MYNGLIIKEMLNERQLKANDLLSRLNSKANSLSQLTHGNPTVSRLEKVADYFQCSMDTFFTREKAFTPYGGTVIGDGNHIGNINSGREKELLAVIDSMQKLLDEKDKRIETLKDMISILKKQQ